MKYILSIFLLFLLNGCMMIPGSMGSMMGMNNDKKSHSNFSMMKCGGMMKMNNSTKEVKHTKDKSMHTKDYVITNRYCSQCHELPAVSTYNKQEWKPTLNRMLSYMKQENKMQPDEYELAMIEHYFRLDN